MDYSVKGLLEGIDKAIEEEKHRSEFEKKVRALPFKYKFSRVHEKKPAALGKIWLIVQVKTGDIKNGFNTYTNYLAVPIKLHEDEMLIYATELYKKLVKDYKLAGE